jgi:protein-disulfide isomerase
MAGHSERPGRLAQLRSVLDLAAVVAFIAVCVLVAWAVLTGRLGTPAAHGTAARAAAPPAPAAPLPSEPIAIAGLPARGNPQALAVAQEFSDFQCPYCGAFARQTLPEIDRRYIETGKQTPATR